MCMSVVSHAVVSGQQAINPEGHQTHLAFVLLNQRDGTCSADGAIRIVGTGYHFRLQHVNLHADLAFSAGEEAVVMIRSVQS